MEERPIIRPKKLSLYKALKLGYLRNERKQKKRLKRFGYVIDSSLSNRERMVGYNPVTNKVIYVSNGSDSNPLNFRQFAKDWGQTNLGGTLTGEIKNTLRYKQEEEAYNKTRQKYQNAKVVLVGHSLAGGIVSRIAKQSDTALTLDPALINQKPRPNVENYRVRGDIVSTFSKDTTTLPNPSNYPNPIQAHNIENIKNQPIFI